MAEPSGQIAASAACVEPDPNAPFYRGEHLTFECDFMPGDGSVCDAPPAYEVWWKPVPALDLDTRPVSAACATHVLAVDRRLVEVMHTHPSVSRSQERPLDGRGPAIAGNAPGRQS